MATLTAALSSGSLLISDSAGVNNNLTISASGTNLVITDAVEAFVSNGGIAGATLSNSDRTLTVPVASITGEKVIVIGADGSDSLTVDMVGGDAILTNGISFDGGNPTASLGDKLNILGGTPGSLFTAFTSSTSALITLGAYGTVDYSGVEDLLIDTDVAPTSASFTLSAGASVAALEDDTAAVAGQLQLRSVSGAGFQTTSFTAPTGNLGISATDGDTLQIAASVATDLASASGLTFAANGVGVNVMQLNAANILPNSLDVTVNSATFDLASFSETIDGLSGTGTVQSTGGTPTLTLGGGNATADFSGVLQNGTGTLAVTKTGTGAQTFSGAVSNTYTGITILDQGNLLLGKTGGATAITGTMQMGAGNANQPNLRMLQSNQFAATAVMTTVNTAGNWVRFDLLGTNQMLTNVNDTIGGLVIENGGIGAISNVNSTLTINNTTNLTLRSHIRNKNDATGTGTLSLIKSGAGQLNIEQVPAVGSRANYTGTTQLNGGTLVLNNLGDAAAPWASSNTTVNSGTTLRTTGNITVGTPAGTSLTLNGGTYSHESSQWFVWSGALNVNGDSTINVVNSGANNQVFFDGGINGPNRILTINNTGTATTGVHFRNGGLGNFSGQLNVNNGEIAIAISALSWFANTDVTLTGATLQLGTAAFAMTTASGAQLRSLNGNGTVTAAGSNTSLTLGTNNGSGTFSGSLISGAGGTLNLIKTGTGTQTLTGSTHNYTGSTTVSGGVLDVNHASALGTAAVGTTLAGGSTLRINGNVTSAEPINLTGDAALANNTVASLVTMSGNVTTNNYSLSTSGAGDLTLNGNLLGGPTNYNSLIMANSPTAYWRLDDSSIASPVVDVVGGRNGSFSGVEDYGLRQSGALGNDTNTAIQFDGANDMISVPSDAGLVSTLSGDYTIQFWMYKDAEATDWVRLVGKGADPNRQVGVWEEAGAGKRVLFQAYNSSGVAIINMFSNSNVEVGQWYHVAAVKQGTTASIYINGVLDAQSTFSGTPATSADPLTFGKAPTLHTFWPGKLDEIAIFGSGLSAATIGQLAQAGTAAGNLTKQGTGTLTLGGNNTNTGVVQVQAGTLVAANSGALGDSLQGTKVAAGATLALSGGVTIADEDFILEGTGASGQLGALVNLSGNNTIGAASTIVAAGVGTTLNIGSVNDGVTAFVDTLTIDAPINLQAANLNFNGTGNVTVSSSITSSIVAPTLANLDNFATGNYTMTAGGDTLPVRIDNDGADSWLLIGRGRQGWQFDTDGQRSVNDVVANLGTLQGFLPAAYSDALVNELLAQAGINNTNVEIRLKRATNTTGTTFQEARWRNFTNANFTYDFDLNGLPTIQDNDGYPALYQIVSGTGATLTDVDSNTNDSLLTPNVDSGNGFQRVFTWAWVSHNNQQGFSLGDTVQGVDNNNPTTYLWEFANEGHAIPYTEVYIRSLTTNVVAPPANTVTKQGTGTVNLAGTSSYTGATTVSAGTLLVNGSISTSPVTVQSGGTLGGTGTTGPLTINSGGTHSPGNSPGITTVVGNYVENGLLVSEIGTPSGSVPGTDYDQVQVTGGGSVTIGATATLSVPYLGGAGTFAPAFAQVYTIIDNDGTVPGDTTGTFTGLAEGATITVDGKPLKIYYHGVDGNNVVLVSANNPSGTLYVNDQFIAPGVVDGDAEQAGMQAAYVGVNAFASIADALTAYPAYSGNIIVNGGTYASALLAGGGNVTLQLVQDLANGQNDVTLQLITGDATDGIVTRLYNVANANLIVEQGTFTGVISGSGNVTKTNAAGTTTLSGTNTYTGGTNVNLGQLVITNPLALGSTAGSTTVADTAQLRMSGGITVTGESITITGAGADFLGALNSFSGTNTWAGPVLLTTTNARVGAANGQTLIISGVISDATTPAALNIRGGSGAAGTVELSGANTYGGATNLIAGNLRIAGADNRIPVGSTLNVGNASNQDAAVFDLNGLNQTVGGLTSVGTTMAMTVTNTGALSTLTVNNAAANTYAGVIAGALNVTKLGAGTLTFSGANANTYSGTTTVTAGVLALGKTAGVNALPGNATINGGTLQLSQANQIIDTAAITLSSGAFNFHNGTTARNETLASLNMSGGALGTAAGGTTNDVVFTGAVAVTGGTFTVNSGTQLSANSFSLTGTGGVVVGGNNATRKSQLTVGPGGLTMQGTLLQLNRGTVAGAMGAWLVLNGNVTTLASATASRILDDGAASPTFFPRVDLNGAVRTFTVADDATANPDLTIGVIVENGGLTKLGPGQMRLTAANTYTGVTTVGAGTLEINGAGGSLTTSPTIDIQAGTFQVTSGANVATTTVTNGGGTGLLAVDNGTMTVSNGINVDDLRVGFSGANPGSATTNNISGTLTVTGGAATFGSGTGNTFLVGHRAGNSNNSDNVTGMLNLAAATGTTINVGAINIGTILSGTGGGAGTVIGNVTLSTAGTNTMTATSTLIGDSANAGNTGGAGSFLNLGNANNTLNTNTLTVAGMKGRGTVVFQGSGGTFQLNGVGGVGTQTALNVGNNNASGTGTISVGTLNTTNGTWNANLSTVLIGRHHSGAGGGQGTVTIEGGLVTATSVTLADPDTGGASTADTNTTGTLNVNGGEFQVNGTITDGDADGSASGGSSVATINLGGGTLRFNTLSRSTATNTFNVNFNSGTLRTNTGVNQVVTNVPISLLTAGTHNFETDPGRTSTIQTGSPIGGTGSLTKLGTGTLILQAANTYSGTTNVNAGVLQLQNGAAILDTAGAVNVANLATLQLLNSETISSYVGADDGANENDSLLAIAGFTLTTTGSATLGNVTTANGSIVAGTAIIDGDIDNNISGTGIFLQAGTSVGTVANPIESTLTNLEGNGGTGFFVANTGNLVIGGVTAAAGIASGGDIAVSAAGSLTVNENVAASGVGSDVSLSTIDAAAVGQNLSVTTGVTISSAAATVTLSAGDNATIPSGARLAAAGTVTVNVDAGDADGGTGGSVSFAGDVDAALAVFNGNSDSGAMGDSFSTIRPDQDTGDVLTPIQIFGFGPTANPNGDSLILDITGLGIPVLTLGPGARNGSFSFGSLAALLTYNDIENVTTSPALPYHIVLDMRYSGYQNSVADTILARLNAAGTELLIDVNGSNVFTGLDNVIQSLTIIGSTDSEALTIQETAGGLPKFIGAAPAVDNTGIGGGVSAGSHLGSSADLALETLLPGGAPWDVNDVTMHFEGGVGGTDSLTVNYTTANSTGYFSDTNDAGNSGNLSTSPGAFPAIGAPTLLISFANVEPLTLNGNGGLLLTDATGTAATSGLTLTDVGPATQIAGNSGFANTTFSGFNSAVVVGGGGAELIDVVSVDNALLTNVTVIAGNTNDLLGLAGGDSSADTVRLQSLPATVAAALNGNAGSDLFQLFDGGNSLDNIAGNVTIDGNDGNVGGNTDTLTMINTGGATGDNAVIAAVNGTSPDYFIDGVTAAVSTDVVFRNIDVLNYTGTTLTDNIDGRFTNTTTPHDLNTVNLSGWTGADSFLLFTSDQIGGTGSFTPTGTASGVNTINLYGDALGNPNGSDVADMFGELPAGVSGTGATNVGLVVPSTTRLIRPSASTTIAINGGTPTGLAAPLGDVAGDTLNVDITSLPNTTPVVVSTFAPGTVVAAGIQPLTWAEIEDINLVDQGKLTNVQMGDLFARTTPGADLVQITRNPTTANPNQVRLRLTASIANYSASNKTIIYAGGSNDTLTQSNLTIPAEFYGEAGDDYITGATNNDWLVGGDGNDRINGGQGDNILWGDNSPTNPGDLTPQTATTGGDDQLSGLGGNDVFYGSGGNDTVSAGAGNDYANGGYGNDTLDGNDGDDRLYGGEGNDILSGGAGSDLLSGGSENDKLYGDVGNDILMGGSGADVLDAGAGNDLLISGSVANQNSVWTSAPNTTTYSPATYADGGDNDSALLSLLVAWSTVGDRTALGAITHDGANDDLFGGTGDDDFCWEAIDVADNSPAVAPQDYNALGMGMDERFGPT